MAKYLFVFLLILKNWQKLIVDFPGTLLKQFVLQIDLSKVSKETAQLERLLEYLSNIKLATKTDFAFDHNPKEILNCLLSKINKQSMPVLTESESENAGEDKEMLSVRSLLANLRSFTKSFLASNSKAD